MEPTKPTMIENPEGSDQNKFAAIITKHANKRTIVNVLWRGHVPSYICSQTEVEQDDGTMKASKPNFFNLATAYIFGHASDENHGEQLDISLAGIRTGINMSYEDSLRLMGCITSACPGEYD